MTKQNKQNQDVQPATTSEGQSEIVAQDVATMPSETAENVVHFAGRTGGKNGFAAFNAQRTEAVKGKVQLVSEAKKLLQQAAELADKADENDEAANEPAAKGGLLLFRGMSQGIISNDEVTDILGSTFGFKEKQNGEPSKTPAGKGEEIRKRVQRAFKAYDYAVNGNEPVSFFEPLDRDDVQPLIDQLLNGGIGLWEFYRQTGELKAERTGKRPPMWADPRRIAALTRSLGENVQNTVAIIQRTPGLFAAYAGLLQMIETIGAEMPVPETESEAA